MSDPIESELKAGTLVNRRYLITASSYQGGMGRLYFAKDVRLDQFVTLKFVNDDGGLNDLDQRLIREAQAGSRLTSPYSIRTFDIDKDERGRLYIVLEYLRGLDFARLLQGAWMEPRQAVRFMLKICQALQEMHMLGMVHRDVKPSNMFLVVNSDDSTTVKLIDFGLAKILGARNLTSMNIGFGSPGFASPEQLENASLTTFRSDIWSVGATLYYMCTGRYVYRKFSSSHDYLQNIKTKQIETPRSIVPTIPRKIEYIILDCLKVDPMKRPPDIGVLIKLFEECVFLPAENSESLEESSEVSLEKRIPSWLRKGGEPDSPSSSSRKAPLRGISVSPGYSKEVPAEPVSASVSPPTKRERRPTTEAAESGDLPPASPPPPSESSEKPASVSKVLDVETSANHTSTFDAPNQERPPSLRMRVGLAAALLALSGMSVFLLYQSDFFSKDPPSSSRTLRDTQGNRHPSIRAEGEKGASREPLPADSAIKIFTGPEGGMYRDVGQKLSNIVRERTGLRPEIIDTQGARDNCKRVAQSAAPELTIGLSYLGTQLVGGADSECGDVSVIAPFYIEMTHLFITKERAKKLKSSNKELFDSVLSSSQPIYVGPKKSGTRAIAESLANHIPFVFRSDKASETSPNADGFAAAMQELETGKIGAAFFDSGIKFPALMKGSRKDNLCLVSIPPAYIEKVKKSRGGRPAEIDVDDKDRSYILGEYKDFRCEKEMPFTTIASYALLITNKSASEAFVGDILKMLYLQDTYKALDEDFFGVLSCPDAAIRLGLFKQVNIHSAAKEFFLREPTCYF